MIRIPDFANFAAVVLVCSLVLPVTASAQKKGEKKAKKAQEAPRSVLLLEEDFEQAVKKPTYVTRNQMTFSARRPKSEFHPKAADGALLLCPGDGGAHSTVAWPRNALGRYRRIEARFRFRLGGGAQGFSYALLATSRFGSKGPAFELYRSKGLPGTEAKYPDWDEPNLWGSLAVAFDGEDPPTDDPFNARGNVHKQPQQEVSLHWNGRELRNRASAVDFTTGEPVVAQVVVDFVTGGAEISVQLNGTPVYEKEFLPHVMPYESRVAFGGRGEHRGNLVSLEDLSVKWSNETKRYPGVTSIHCFDSEWLGRGKNSTKTSDFDLFEDNRPYERILMTIKLLPLVKRDEWDRLGHVSLIDAEGRRWELARLLTPFMMWGASYRWDVDVTQFRHLLRGKVKLSASGGANVGNGFAMDLDFHYYKRPKGVAALPRVLGVGYLWHQGISFRKGQRANWPKPIELTPPAGTKRIAIHTCVTGHGIQEFRPSVRTLKVNGHASENRLWTTDNYLNPYRPQFGTWKYNRAGWGPGSIGRVWILDVTSFWKKDGPLRVEYLPEDAKFDKWASHELACYAVYYDR